MESHFFQYDSAVLHYYTYGKGEKVLLCFHGYGQRAEIFSILGQRLNAEFRLYSFDLFAHGRSTWPSCQQALEPDHLADMILAFLESKNIEKVSLCGYSMGGKTALTLLEKMSQRVEKILLIAPDGIRTNPWFTLVTFPYFTRTLFHYTINHPQLFLRTAHLLNSLNVLHKSVYKFAITQMDTRQKRQKVYCSWMIYRKLRPSVKQVARLLNESNIPIQIYLGRYDKVITKRSIAPLLRRVPHLKLTLINKGHNHLIQDTAQHPGFEF